MMRLSLLFFVVGAGLQSWSAEATPATVDTPDIPGHRIVITDHGAVGDGKTICTAAIRSALAACARAGGGQVVVPEGDFLCGPIELASRTDLHLVKGARLRMSQNRADFVQPDGRTVDFIYTREATDVQISGEGTLDGQGKPWWDRVREMESRPEQAKNEPRRPQLIVFDRCERVRLSGVTTMNPPNTHCSIRRCRDLMVEGVTMLAPDDSANTDGLNLTVTNAVIRDCHIATGDDNIVLLASYPAPGGGPGGENVHVSRCTLGVGHGLSIGSYTSGGVRNVVVEDVSFNGTTSGIRMKSSRGRGGLVENVSFSRITMQRVKYPIFLSSYYPREPKHPDEDPAKPLTPKTPLWRHLRIEHVTLTDCVNSIIIHGVPELPFENVEVRNLKADSEYGARIIHAKDVRLAEIDITPLKGPVLTTHHAEVEGLASEPLKCGK